ncbi:hypothetical protein [Luteolibacter soli]|uniref:Uncharacterized protein n=1 Tax=Luteolibacter soli TaxID=3135280 RepID=A0ABU9AZ30_9BACT
MAVLFVALLGIAVKNMRQEPDASDAKDDPPDVELRETASKEEGNGKTGRPSRAIDSGSKLRSLFDVRKGEIAAVSVSPEIMKQLLIQQAPDATAEANGADQAGPKMVGILNRNYLLSLLEPAETSVRGAVDTSEDAFDLKVGSMTISGDSFGVPEGTRLHIRVVSGANSIECITRVSEGACVLLSSGGENPEGVVIVTGPRGEVGDARE